MGSQILEATVLILILGLILAHAAQFSTALGAAAAAYQGSVRTLASVAG